MILKLFAYLYFVGFVLLIMFFFFGIIVEKHLDNCNPIKKLWRKHVIDYDPLEPRPEGTLCEDEGRS